MALLQDPVFWYLFFFFFDQNGNFVDITKLYVFWWRNMFPVLFFWPKWEFCRQSFHDISDSWINSRKLDGVYESFKSFQGKVDTSWFIRACMNFPNCIKYLILVYILQVASCELIIGKNMVKEADGSAEKMEQQTGMSISEVPFIL